MAIIHGCAIAVPDDEMTLVEPIFCGHTNHRLTYTAEDEWWGQVIPRVVLTARLTDLGVPTGKGVHYTMREEGQA